MTDFDAAGLFKMGSSKRIKVTDKPYRGRTLAQPGALRQIPARAARLAASKLKENWDDEDVLPTSLSAVIVEEEDSFTSIESPANSNKFSTIVEEASVNADQHSPVSQPRLVGQQVITSDVGLGANVVTDFPSFKKLPVELRMKIWRYAIVPRIIGLRGTKVASVLQACSESRSDIEHYWWMSNERMAFIANPEADLLYFDRKLFSSDFSYHRDGLNTLTREKVDKEIVSPIQRVALTLNEFSNICTTVCFSHFLVKELVPQFPNIKELVIILLSGCSFVVPEHDDLFEVQDDEGPWLKGMIAHLREIYER
jgi:hypothetical protein